MAKSVVAPSPAAAGAAKAPQKSGKSKMLIIVAAVLVLVGAGGGGAWWYFNRGHDAHPKAAVVKAPLFHSIEPFTVNLLEEHGDHYLQVAVVFQVEDEKSIEQIKTYLPVIRSRFLLLLSGKYPSDLSTPQGKSTLVEELVATARESLPAGTRERGIRGAYLGAFVIQ